MSENLKVLIIEKETLMQVGLRTIIKANWKDVEFLTDTNADEDFHETPDIIILGTLSNYKSDDVNQFQRLINKFPFSGILVFSELKEWLYAIPHLRAGPQGYLSKSADERSIILAIETVLEGKHFFAALN